MANKNNSNNPSDPYAFRIHEPHNNPTAATPTSAATMAGWTETSYIEGGLLNNIPVGLYANKTATSIPSIFARIFRFDGAFQTLNLNDRSINSDTVLVSECLDLIEFIFEHGTDPHLVTICWNAAEQIKNLRTSNIAEHIKLAQVLEDEVKNQNGLLDNIYLFYWKAPSPQDVTIPTEYLIGGTSPFTLVFTSPNWKRTVAENNFKFNRLDGSPMFQEDSVKSLMERDKQFKDMLYSLHMAYTDLGSQAPWFERYIAANWQMDVQDPAVTQMGSDKEAFGIKYPPIKDNQGAVVTAATIPIVYLKAEADQRPSGYEIVPKAMRYQSYKDKNSQTHILPTPLALNDNGLPGVPYIGRSQWDRHICKIDEPVVRATEMHERVLPGNSGVKRPFLIWSDFLEDKIVKVPYKIYKEKFYTACSGDTQYLLPLKRDFFKYFNIEDVEKEACPGVSRKLVEVTVEGDAVTVVINVPIKDTTHRTIEFKKKYQSNEIVDSQLLLGFFPFYRCLNNTGLNRYSVMKCGNASKLRFLPIEHLDTPIASVPVERTASGALFSQTEYYPVNESFGLVEVELKLNQSIVKAMIVPKMTELNQGANAFEFAVDFGTSNTYIAYRSQADPNNIMSFEYDTNDQQTVFLINPESGVDDLWYSTMKSIITREFAPERLGKGKQFSYPTRSATCEVPEFDNLQPALFGNISIGFNIMGERRATTMNYKYKTGLKWLIEDKPGDSRHANRVLYFFIQTLWMMKNKALLNGGNDQFNVYITFPEVMKAPTRTTLLGLWEQARQYLGINCRIKNQHTVNGVTTRYSESIAPYNCMSNEIKGQSYLNIDIGGGTTDMLFVYKDEGGKIQNAYYSSVKFAADELWGDGVRINENQPADNGFVTYVLGEINEEGKMHSEDVTGPLTTLQSMTNSSDDVMSYLFKFDASFRTSDKIKNQQNLYSLVFIHYAALMYHVARLIKKMEIPIPEKISFTGMGSKYTSLIYSDGSVQELTKLLLEKYTGKKVSPAFEIISVAQDVKEITAIGTLMGFGLAANYKIPAGQLNPIIDYGFDSKGATINYNQVTDPTSGVKAEVIKEFRAFVDSMKDKDVRSFLNLKYGHIITDKLLDDLKLEGEASFKVMSANVPDDYAALDLTETLFFWPLKDALVRLSKKYDRY